MNIANWAIPKKLLLAFGCVISTFVVAALVLLNLQAIKAASGETDAETMIGGNVDALSKCSTCRAKSAATS